MKAHQFNLKYEQLDVQTSDFFIEVKDCVKHFLGDK